MTQRRSSYDHLHIFDRETPFFFVTKHRKRLKEPYLRGKYQLQFYSFTLMIVPVPFSTCVRRKLSVMIGPGRVPSQISRL